MSDRPWPVPGATTRSRFRSLVPAAAMLAAACGHAQAAELTVSQNPAPHVLMIVADDLGYGDPGFNGRSLLPTPHLDRLAASGRVFQHYYSASPVCSPSRGALLTARYPAELGLHGHLAAPEQNAQRGMPDHLDPSVSTLPAALRSRGYATFHIGKWHLGSGPDSPPPTAYGYDASWYTDFHGRPGSGDRALRDAWREHATATGIEAGEGVPRHASTALMVDLCLKALQADPQKPAFISLCTLIPHTPLEPSPQQLRSFADYTLPSDAGLTGWFADYVSKAKDRDARLRVYLATLQDFDAQIGRLLDGIAALGAKRDAMILLTSDNGPEDYALRLPGPKLSNPGMGSPGPLRGRKRSLYDGGVRVPFVATWPGRIPAGVDTSSVIGAVDVAPTILSLVGAPRAMPEASGEDRSEVLLGRAMERSRPLFFEWLFEIMGPAAYRSPGLAVRGGRFKLLVSDDLSRRELYDVVSDPGERLDLASSEPERVASLLGELVAWRSGLPPARLRRAMPPVDRK